jgi:hypothetical protein
MLPYRAILILGALLYSGMGAPVYSAPVYASSQQSLQEPRRKSNFFKNLFRGFSDRWDKSEEKEKFVYFFETVQQNFKNGREEMRRQVQDQIDQLAMETSKLFDTVLSDTGTWGAEMKSLRDQLKNGGNVSVVRLLRAKWEELQANTTLARSEVLKHLSDLGAAKAADVLRIAVKEQQELAKKAAGWFKDTLQLQIERAEAKIEQIKAFVVSEGSARVESFGEVMDVLSERFGQIEALMDDPSQWFTWGAIPALKDQRKALEKQLRLMKEAIQIKADELVQAALFSRDTLISKRAELQQRLQDLEVALSTAQGEVLAKLLLEKDILVEQIDSVQERITNSTTVIQDRIQSSMENLKAVLEELQKDAADVAQQLSKAGLFNLDLKKELNKATTALDEWKQTLEQSLTNVTETLNQVLTPNEDLLSQLGRIQAGIQACMVCSTDSNVTECTLNLGRKCTDEELTQLRNQQEKLEAQIDQVRRAISERWAAVDANLMGVASAI